MNHATEFRWSWCDGMRWNYSLTGQPKKKPRTSTDTGGSGEGGTAADARAALIARLKGAAGSTTTENQEEGDPADANDHEDGNEHEAAAEEGA